LELLDLGAAAADDDARTRGPNRHSQLVARAIDLDRTNARRLQTLAQLILDLLIFSDQIGVAVARKPARTSGLRVPQPEPVRMNFLTHLFTLRSPRFLGYPRRHGRRKQKR